MRKLLSTCLLVLLMVTAFAATSTTAAWWNTSKETKQAIRVNRLPEMTFLRGRLHQDHSGAWEINYTELRLTQSTTLTDANGRRWQPDPRKSAEVMLMGYYVGDCFVVHSGRVLNTMPYSGHSPIHDQIEWSESDPNVGVGSGTIPM